VHLEYFHCRISYHWVWIRFGSSTESHSRGCANPERGCQKWKKLDFQLITWV
jgi:hypothetical protein